MKYLILFLLFVSSNVYSNFEFFPDQRPFATSHTVLFNSIDGLNINYMHNEANGMDYTGLNFGFKFVLFGYYDEDLKFDLSVNGRIATRFELGTESFNQVHTDYMGGMSLDFLIKNVVLVEFLTYHVSSHLGDDAVQYDNETYVNSGWESSRLYVNYVKSSWLRVGPGIEYKWGRRPSDRVFYNLSIYFSAFTDFSNWDVPLFFEIETERFSVYRSANYGVKLGLYLDYLVNKLLLDKDFLGDKKHVLYFHYYNGYSKIGYQYNRKEELFLVGRTFRF